MSRRMLEAEAREQPIDAAVEEALCEDHVDIGHSWRKPPVVGEA
jgi:hypothetical protein